MPPCTAISSISSAVGFVCPSHEGSAVSPSKNVAAGRSLLPAVPCGFRDSKCGSALMLSVPLCCSSSLSSSRKQNHRTLAPPMRALANSGETQGEDENAGLEIGAAVVVVEPPLYVKTAEPMPRFRPNDGFIKVGDAGRIMDRRPKGLWAVRFAEGAFLIERKYFKLL